MARIIENAMMMLVVMPFDSCDGDGDSSNDDESDGGTSDAGGGEGDSDGNCDGDDHGDGGNAVRQIVQHQFHLHVSGYKL